MTSCAVVVDAFHSRKFSSSLDVWYAFILIINAFIYFILFSF